MAPASPPPAAARPARAAQPCAGRPPGCPSSSSAICDLIGLGARRAVGLLRVPDLPRLGRRARPATAPSRACAGWSAPSTTSCPPALMAAGADARAAPGAAGGPARSARARCACSRRSRSRSRRARSASARAASACASGTPRASSRAAGWWGRGSTGRRSSLLGHVGAHIVAIFLFVAAVLLLTGASVGGRDEGHERLGHHHGAAAARRHGDAGRAPARHRRAGGAGGGAGGRRDRRRSTKRDFWSGDERFPDLYDEAPPPERS